MTLRLRSRMMGLVLSAMLMMTLTSFRPVGTPPESQNVDQQIVDERNVDEMPRRASETPHWFQRRRYEPRVSEPAPYTVRLPRRPDVLRPDVERIRDDEEELRQAIEELRDRIETELRRRARDQHHHHYEYRSTRWIRKLPKPVREWAQARQETIVAWARDP
jgi:hypothetical protein